MPADKCKSTNGFRKPSMVVKVVIESVMRNRYLNILKVSFYELLTNYEAKMWTL